MELVQSDPARGQAQGMELPTSNIGSKFNSKIPIRKYTSCPGLEVKYLKAKTTGNQKPPPVPIMNKFTQTDLTSVFTRLMQVPVVVPRLMPEQRTEQTPITGAMGTVERQNTEVTPLLEANEEMRSEVTPMVEALATIEANEEQQPMMTEWICILIYIIGKIRSALQDSIPIRILLHYCQGIQTAIPEIWPEFSTNCMQFITKWTLGLINILHKLSVKLFHSCKSLLAGIGIGIIIFIIWAYIYGEPIKRLECAVEELTKDRTVASNIWMNLF